MKISRFPQITHVEVLQGDALVEFDNGESILYPCDLLYAARDLAHIMRDAPEPDSNADGAAPAST